MNVWIIMPTFFIPVSLWYLFRNSKFEHQRRNGRLHSRQMFCRADSLCWRTDSCFHLWCDCVLRFPFDGTVPSLEISATLQSRVRWSDELTQMWDHCEIVHWHHIERPADGRRDARCETLWVARLLKHWFEKSWNNYLGPRKYAEWATNLRNRSDCWIGAQCLW